MKLRYILTTVLAGLTLLFGCTPMELIRTTDNVKAEPSYLEILPDGGEVKSTVIAGDNWTITEVPEWLTVSPTSGSATDEKGVTVTFSAGVTYESRKAQVLVNVGEESMMITIKQGAAIAPRSFEAGDYWIIAKNSEGKYKAAMPVASGYGYLAVSDPEEVDGKLQGKAGNIFTFTAVEGGYTITDTYGNYYYMNGDYDSFNVTTTAPTDGSHIWSVEAAEGDAWKIMNNLKGKYIQLDASYGTYGCYSAAKGSMPLLVKVEIEIEPEPLGDATDIKDIVNNEPEVIIEGLVTATCTKGVIITDETASVYAYGAPAVALGDKVKLLGTFSNYNKGYQLKDITQHEVISSENKITYPEPVELTESAVAGLIKPAYMLAQYASVKGLVEVDSYNNALISVGEYKVKTNYYAESFADYKDKALELKGYVISYKESSKELNMVVTSFEELTDWAPEVPEPKTDAIKDVIASETAVYNVEGTVVASGSSAYIIADATGNLIVYGKDHNRTVGEKVKVSGTAAHYNGYNTNTVQLTAADEVEVVSTGNTWTYNPTVLDGAALDALIGKAAVCSEVQFTGSLAISGKYANITVEGATNTGSLSNVDVLADYSSFDGKTVVVKGYITGTYGRLSVQPYSVVAVDSEGGEEDNEDEGNTEVSGDLVITDADFPTAYPTEEAVITVDGVDFKILNVANYGNGIQIKKETGYIANATDKGKISTLKLVWKKNFYPENLVVTVGATSDVATAAPAAVTDDDSMTATFDLSSGDYNFFKIANTSTYATYLEKIEITFAK